MILRAHWMSSSKIEKVVFLKTPDFSMTFFMDTHINVPIYLNQIDY